jgi:hypothetical protein
MQRHGELAEGLRIVLDGCRQGLDNPALAPQLVLGFIKGIDERIAFAHKRCFLQFQVRTFSSESIAFGAESRESRVEARALGFQLLDALALLLKFYRLFDELAGALAALLISPGQLMAPSLELLGYGFALCGEGIAFRGKSRAVGFELLDALAFLVNLAGFRGEKARAGIQLFPRRGQFLFPFRDGGFEFSGAILESG